MLECRQGRIAWSLPYVIWQWFSGITQPSNGSHFNQRQFPAAMFGLTAITKDKHTSGWTHIPATAAITKDKHTSDCTKTHPPPPLLKQTHVGLYTHTPAASITKDKHTSGWTDTPTPVASTTKGTHTSGWTHTPTPVASITKDKHTSDLTRTHMPWVVASIDSLVLAVILLSEGKNEPEYGNEVSTYLFLKLW